MHRGELYEQVESGLEKNEWMDHEELKSQNSNRV